MQMEGLLVTINCVMYFLETKAFFFGTCQGENHSDGGKKTMSKALLEIDAFPSTGYEGEVQGNRFIITHPDLPPPIQIELHA